MRYQYQIVDSLGRMWAQTVTRIKAAKIVKTLHATKGLSCTIKEITQ